MAKEQQPQPLQAVRLLGTTELKHIQIRNQERTPIVYWGDIQEQFPNTPLALHIGNGYDILRDSNKQLYVYPFPNNIVPSQRHSSMHTTCIN